MVFVTRWILIRRFVTSYETKDRALAGAVSTYEPDMLARIHLQSGTAQHVLNAIGFMNI